MLWDDLVKLVEEVRPLLDANGSALSIEDTDGNTIFVNEAYEKMMRRGRKNLVSEGRDIVKDGDKAGRLIVHHDITQINRLREELDRLNEKLRKSEGSYTFDHIVGKDPALLKTIKIAKDAAVTPATIMIRGESGTGKEIFANAIHNASNRRHEKFIKINCSSVPEELLESELFGYREGAFTGALRGGKKGIFQEAHRGTLFLDEIGDVSSKMQVKLLRVLQEKEVLPVGGTEAVKTDVRIICATNKPLEDMVQRGEFREDLYYRLNVFPLYIPPLRERRGDIGPIATSLVWKYNQVYGREVMGIEEEALALLESRDWRGNVRELENVIARGMINVEEGAGLLSGEDIRAALHEGELKKAPWGGGQKTGGAMGWEPKEGASLQETLAQVERDCIQRALAQNRGDKNKAAYDLGIPLRTLYHKCKKLGI